MYFALIIVKIKNKAMFMRFVLCIVMTVMLSACSKNISIEPPLEVLEHKSKIQVLPKKEQLPPLKEVLTLGYLHENRKEILKEREKQFIRKYVSDENDERSFLQKIIGKSSLNIIMGRETKQQFAERKELETKQASEYVSNENDERGFTAKSLNKLTLGLLADKETKKEYQKRLVKEAKKAKAYDQRSLFLKSIEVATLGTFSPGKPKPMYDKDAVYFHPTLGKLIYGESTWQDTIKLLGEPIKKITYKSGQKDATFKVSKGSYQFIPYLKKPQINVNLSFDIAGVLIKK